MARRSFATSIGTFLNEKVVFYNVTVDGFYGYSMDMNSIQNLSRLIKIVTKFFDIWQEGHDVILVKYGFIY